MQIAADAAVMRRFGVGVWVGWAVGESVSLPLGTQKGIPEFQVAGASATVTPVMSR